MNDKLHTLFIQTRKIDNLLSTVVDVRKSLDEISDDRGTPNEVAIDLDDLSCILEDVEDYFAAYDLDLRTAWC